MPEWCSVKESSGYCTACARGLNYHSMPYLAHLLFKTAALILTCGPIIIPSPLSLIKLFLLGVEGGIENCQSNTKKTLFIKLKTMLIPENLNIQYMKISRFPPCGICKPIHSATLCLNRNNLHCLHTFLIWIDICSTINFFLNLDKSVQSLTVQEIGETCKWDIMLIQYQVTSICHGFIFGKRTNNSSAL